MLSLFRLVSFTASMNTDYRSSGGYSGCLLWFEQNYSYMNLLNKLLFASISS